VTGPPDSWLTPRDPSPLNGDEQFTPSATTVLDFWRWAFSDLQTNVVRGILAEYLVAQALGDPSPVRRAWDDFDVTSRGGIRVEVKSAAYLQSWRQRALSKITFTGLRGASWSDETGRSETRTLRADVFVFAVHTCTTHADYDPLNIAQWEFRVLSRSTLEALGSRSIGLGTLTATGALPVNLADLPAAVEAAAAENP
jgi:hypothetical protein